MLGLLEKLIEASLHMHTLLDAMNVCTYELELFFPSLRMLCSNVGIPCSPRCRRYAVLRSCCYGYRCVKASCIEVLLLWLQVCEGELY